MPPSSLTLNYDAVLSTALFNYNRTLVDQISKSNAFFFLLMKGGAAYTPVDSIGDRMGMRLMYGLAPTDSYSGYDTLDTTPTDGISMAFWDWAQCSSPVAISGLEEKKTTGENSLADLLTDKIKQTEVSLQEFFNKSFLQGNGTTNITTRYTSAANGSTFIDPLALVVKFDPTTTTTVGNIPQGANTWWRNQTLTSGSTTFAGFLKDLRKLRNDCSRGPGGAPDMHLTDQNTIELYEAALANAHRNPSYQSADIPFDNIGFYKRPVVWDELVPDVSGGSVTQSTTSGTWWMLNTKYWGIKYHRGTNFVNTPFQKPENQDAKVAHILWLGGVGTNNRRKQGVMGSIDTTMTS